MKTRIVCGFVLCSAFINNSVSQEQAGYEVPLTEHGQPDFQGVWATEFVVPFERPEGVENLIATEQQNAELTDAIRASYGDLQDPDLYAAGTLDLARVNGQYRTSIVIEPENGIIPYTEAGLKLVEWSGERFVSHFDHPEQRPLTERCLDGWVSAPMRSLPIFFPRQIVQTREHVVIQMEDAAGLRILRIGDEMPANVVRTVAGYSLAHWDNDTLVVRTTHLLANDPMRDNFGRPIVLSPDTEIEERFQRISESELVYTYTVSDPDLYSQPWKGEYSMQLHDGDIYEYACHEGNYSMPGILLGGRMPATP